MIKDVRKTKIALKVNEEEYSLLKNKAKTLGLTLASFVRTTAIKEANE